MSIKLSPTVAAARRGSGDTFSVTRIEIDKFGEFAAPICLFDDFRVSGRPFGPHPHAGFSQITYVFRDSLGGNRSRDSLGNDIIVGPGGIVWTQAGSGMLHQEVPVEATRELHGLQVFVNLSAAKKFVAPRVLHLAAECVPIWQSPEGDTVRVVVGSFGTISSPLVPEEPFDFLDVDLQDEIVFALAEGRNAIVYVLQGPISLLSEEWEREIPSGNAVALTGQGHLTFAASRATNFLILSGLDIREPVLADGPFIMSNRSQLDDAFARFRAGKMGRLEPLRAG